MLVPSKTKSSGYFFLKNTSIVRGIDFDSKTDVVSYHLFLSGIVGTNLGLPKQIPNLIMLMNEIAKGHSSNINHFLLTYTSG
jgi:hypothetical protein